MTHFVWISWNWGRSRTSNFSPRFLKCRLESDWIRWCQVMCLVIPMGWCLVVITGWNMTVPSSYWHLVIRLRWHGQLRLIDTRSVQLPRGLFSSPLRGILAQRGNTMKIHAENVCGDQFFESRHPVKPEYLNPSSDCIGYRCQSCVHQVLYLTSRWPDSIARLLVQVIDCERSGLQN